MIDKIKSFVISLVSKKLFAYLGAVGIVSTMPGLEPNLKAGLDALLTIIYIIVQGLIDKKKLEIK